MKNILSTEQVAEKLGVTTETIRRLLKSGLLKGFKIGGYGKKRHWRIKQEALEAFVNGNDQQGRNNSGQV